MNALMAELAPYILAGLFGLVGWYLRDNQRQHGALVSAVSKLSDTIVGLEQRLEERVETHSRRFERYALAQERRMTELETRCAFEHGDLPDRRQPRQHHVIDWQQASDVGGSNKSVKPTAKAGGQ